MAGVTDLTFRCLCKEQGAALVCTEMVSAKGLYYNSKNTRQLMEIAEMEHPVALQFFGEDPEIMSKMAKWVEKDPFDILDINMGCPVPKVVNNQEGSALMKNPKRIEEIVSAITKAIQKPVTVKIRKGFYENENSAVEAAKAAEAGGAAAVAVHGRTREQYYSGKADWSVIKQVKEAIKVPVIGNGDVNSPETAKRMLEETGCDAIMIGRAALGNPWLFAQVNAYLEQEKKLVAPQLPEVIAMILRHYDMVKAHKGEEIAVREMRKHIGWYTGGYPHSAHLRSLVNQQESYERVLDILKHYEVSFLEGTNPFL